MTMGHCDLSVFKFHLPSLVLDVADIVEPQHLHLARFRSSYLRESPRSVRKHRRSLPPIPPDQVAVRSFLPTEEMITSVGCV